MHSPDDSFISCAWHRNGTKFYVGGTRGQFLECVRGFFLFFFVFFCFFCFFGYFITMTLAVVNMISYICLFCFLLFVLVLFFCCLFFNSFIFY